MNSIIVALQLFCFSFLPSISSHNIDVEKHWTHFKTKHEKLYSAEEEFHRREIFEANLFKILNHNIEADLGNQTYRLELNQFADLTPEEVTQRYKGFKKGRWPSKPNQIFTTNLSSADVQKNLDWRTEGLVTPVKNQGQCGACWAFSTTGSLEGIQAKATGKLVSLSEQNLIDCSTPEGNLGCDGGVMQYAFEYILRNRGVDTESAYPYEAKNGVCRFKKCKVGATIKGYVDIPVGSELALQHAVSKVGPVSVALDASLETFNFYSGGIYNDRQCSSTSLDHAGTLVGYGTDEDTGQDYWLIKNSWGEAWGEKGYMRLARNLGNLCGVATQACYPIV